MVFLIFYTVEIHVQEIFNRTLDFNVGSLIFEIVTEGVVCLELNGVSLEFFGEI